MPDQILVLQVRDDLLNRHDIGEEIAPGVFAMRIADVDVLAKLTEILSAVDGLEVSVGDVDVNTDQLETLVQQLPKGLVDDPFDYIELGYTGDNLTTAEYKTGGAGGTTIATLTLAYTGARLDSITKT